MIAGNAKMHQYEQKKNKKNTMKNKQNHWHKLIIILTNYQKNKQYKKEKTLRMNWPTVGETIKLGRKIGIQLKEKYGLKFNPILIDITTLKAVSPKAVLFTGKLTIKRGDVCTSCMKTLTDEFSMLTGMGKICANHLGIDYITDASQAQRFREEYLKRVEEIGEMEFWVPKSQIVKWEGSTAKILPMLSR